MAGLPGGKMVPLEDERQRGAEFRIHGDGAPQLGVSQSSPGLHLHQHTYVNAHEHPQGRLSECVSGHL